MDKVERLITIIMILLKKDIVPSSEFAQLFGVSKRTILRDMEALSLAHIPIYATPGVQGGYGIMEEYKMDKRLLSSSDLENILAALGGLEQILISEDVAMTLRKIEAMVSPLASKGSVQLSFYGWEGRAELAGAMKLCQEAIAGSRLLSFDYTDRTGTPTTRTVEPYQLHFSESSWYLKGFCLERMGARMFKLSRMEQLERMKQTFSPRADMLNQAREAEVPPQLTEVKALISPGIKDQFIERYGRKSIEAYNAEQLLATFYIPQHPIGYQFLAGFGTHLEIMEPKAYREEFRKYLLEMMSRYT
ncbi:Helix-turn-helix type 11 domain-containing protein [Paenibacillus sp. FSL R7-277]|uniref:helix-turn-helix transcriptional regulator n=1 Tax=Paenibacillus sp. FSL R7-277 TaxID=1227352 RepID=UPI0003E2C003|nr:YafY family protein [Paenibacillus sp. FSL R7-277]ETT77146.1 Helix-turn-helix type 11 domain-containing protein [Paenibacillus sp. FSL R7-277]